MANELLLSSLWALDLAWLESAEGGRREDRPFRSPRRFSIQGFALSSGDGTGDLGLGSGTGIWLWDLALGFRSGASWWRCAMLK